MKNLDVLKMNIKYQNKTLLDKLKLPWYTRGFWTKLIYVMAHISLAIYVITLLAYALK